MAHWQARLRFVLGRNLGGSLASRIGLLEFLPFTVGEAARCAQT